MTKRSTFDCDSSNFFSMHKKSGKKAQVFKHISFQYLFIEFFFSVMSKDLSNLTKESPNEVEPMAADKIVPNENTEKLKVLMRQLSEQSPIMNGSSNTLAKRYTKIFLVVTLYW